MNSVALCNDATPTNNIVGGLHDDDAHHHLIELRDTLNYTPDSGILTASCSSGSAMAGGSSSSSYKPINFNTPTPENGNCNGNAGGSNNSNNNNSHKSYTSKLFQQKIAKVRKNYRNHFGDDSDSD
jgi:DDB1- and CUL4-associated factor 5